MLPSSTANILRMKYIKGALNAPTVRVDDPSGWSEPHWSQVDLVNPMDSDLMFVAGLAEHSARDVFDLSIRWHQAVLVLNGELVVQNLETGDVYRAREGDLFYWGPGLKIRMGGKFRAYHVRTPATWRWIKTKDGRKGSIDPFNIKDEILYPGSPPEEIRQYILEEGNRLPKGKGVRIKLVRNALKAQPVEVNDLVEMPHSRWRQIDLINPADANTSFVAGIAEYPVGDISKAVSSFWYHQTALIIEGQMIVQDLDTGGVYKINKGDLIYWAPGHRHHIGGKFKAFFCKTPIPLRWVIAPNGKKKVLDMHTLEGETSYPSSPPDEVRKQPMTTA